MLTFWNYERNACADLWSAPPKFAHACLYRAWPLCRMKNYLIISSRRTRFEKTFKMAAQPPPYAPESSFPQVKQNYQEVPAQQNKPTAVETSAASSDYAPAPPQFYSENNVSTRSLLTWFWSKFYLNFTDESINVLLLSRYVPCQYSI